MGIGLATILLLAGMSSPLQFEQIGSGMLISAISQWREAYCRYKSQNRYPAGKLTDNNVIGVSTISSLHAIYFFLSC
jgi:hypothetical protein